MKHSVKVSWKKKQKEAFTDHKYSRSHQWFFDGGAVVIASSSPEVVAVPMSDITAVDPEEAFIAALSSCHMLFFLSIAAAKKYIVTSYEDNVEGIMKHDKDGKITMSEIYLKPKASFTKINIPTQSEIAEFHKLAHDKCYIANSIKSVVNIHPQ